MKRTKVIVPRIEVTLGNKEAELLVTEWGWMLEGDMEGARRAQFAVNSLLGVRFGIPDPYAAASLHTSKLYLARKGVKIKPYQWGRQSFDNSRMDDFENAIDAAVASVKP